MADNSFFKTKKQRLKSGDGLGYGTTLDWSSEIVDSTGVSASSGRVSPGSEVAVTDGLIHHYPLNDGTADDQVGNANGTVNGATHLDAGGPQEDGAFNLGGVSDYIEIPAGLLEDSYSLSTWVYLDSTSDWQRWFDIGADNKNHVYAAIPDANGNLTVTYKNGGADVYNLSASLPAPGNWVHLVHTSGDGSAEIYINGSLAASVSATTDPSSDWTPSAAYFGKSFAADPYLDGRLDNIRIYNRKLGEDGVQAIQDSERA